VLGPDLAGVERLRHLRHPLERVPVRDHALRDALRHPAAGGDVGRRHRAAHDRVTREPSELRLLDAHATHLRVDRLAQSVIGEMGGLGHSSRMVRRGCDSHQQA
jgi:hypothetical protein